MTDRIRDIVQVLEENNIDALLVSKQENVRYFSGFTGDSTVLFIMPDAQYLITDARYTEQAEQEAPAYTVITHSGMFWEGLLPLWKDRQRQVLGYERTEISHALYCNLEEQLQPEKMVGVALDGLRMIKSSEEISYLETACQIADEAFAELLPEIRPGVTERYLQGYLEWNMLKRGAEEKSFDTIVASGRRSSLPHGTATDKQIEKGDFITFDFGAVYKGYHSDITRTVVVGQPTEEQKQLYDRVLHAQCLGVESVRPGLSGKDVDQIVRQYFKEQSCDEYFIHSLGHGIGLEIHELPVLSPKSTAILASGMVVTVEPGLYIPNFGGVRIEDSVLVTEKGCRILTKTTKELLVL